MNNYGKSYRVKFMINTINFVALVLSYCVNKSILWAILHFFFGWFYVAYFLLVHTKMCALVSEYLLK